MECPFTDTSAMRAGTRAIHWRDNFLPSDRVLVVWLVSSLFTLGAGAPLGGGRSPPPPHVPPRYLKPLILPMITNK
jgi:hypothetical protein